jgi:hypothetical protein
MRKSETNAIVRLRRLADATTITTRPLQRRS